MPADCYSVARDGFAGSNPAPTSNKGENMPTHGKKSRKHKVKKHRHRKFLKATRQQRQHGKSVVRANRKQSRGKKKKLTI